MLKRYYKVFDDRDKCVAEGNSKKGVVRTAVHAVHSKTYTLVILKPIEMKVHSYATMRKKAGLPEFKAKE